MYKQIHELNRSEVENYIEIVIECDIDERMRRDQKGLYSKAIKGERDYVVGVNLPYDKPLNCEMIIENS